MYDKEVTDIPTTIAFRVDDDFHAAVKIQATKEKKTLQDYIIEAIKKDMEEKAKQEQK